MSDSFELAPISQLFGFQVLPPTEKDRELGQAIVALEVDQRLHNPMGQVHGGVLAALADAAMGIAFGRTLEEGKTFSTIDLHIHFMRPVISKKLFAEGKLIQRGLKIAFLECTITDTRGRLICRASCSCMVG